MSKIQKKYLAFPIYEQSEIDTISGSLQTNIDGKSDSSHLHDDRYYTGSEVDGLITTLSGSNLWEESGDVIQLKTPKDIRLQGYKIYYD